MLDMSIGRHKYLETFIIHSQIFQTCEKKEERKREGEIEKK